VQTAQTANRQPLMLGALLVLMIVVAVLFIQLRAANKSTPAVAPSIPPPSVAGEKPAAPAPSPPPPASPASAAVEAPPADKVPADKVPADKVPADKMPADKMPADKMPADKMIDHVQDNKSDAAKARAKTPKPRGVGKKAEVRSDRDAAAPKASKPSKPEDPEQPWR
jgi:type IV secretory pathway VirB10-like protein